MEDKYIDRIEAYFKRTLNDKELQEFEKNIQTDPELKKLFEEYSWLKGHYWGGEVWAGGYFIRSVGSGLTKQQIEKYIKEQSEEC